MYQEHLTVGRYTNMIDQCKGGAMQTNVKDWSERLTGLKAEELRTPPVKSSRLVGQKSCVDDRPCDFFVAKAAVENVQLQSGEELRGR
jgi:hypothetical protein